MRTTTTAPRGTGATVRPRSTAPVVAPATDWTTESHESAVRRNTGVLAGALALAWAVIQVQGSLIALTTESLLRSTALAGLGPATFLVASGLATIPAGRLMDRWGRVPGLSLGFLVAAIGCGLLFSAVTFGSTPLFFVGLLALGAGLGAVGLARAGAADMYRADERAKGVGRVLVGAAVGAIAAPIVFGPLLASRTAQSASSLAAPWILAAALCAVGAGIVWVMRQDPLALARRMEDRDAGLGSSADLASAVAAPGLARSRPMRRRRLAVIYADAGARAALIAVIAAQLVMTAAMSLVSLSMHHNGHDLGSISIALAAHLVGMFGLSLWVGRWVDRTGRRSSLGLGLGVLAAGVLGLAASESLVTVLPSIFIVGLGWNVAYVAGTALIADATRPDERGAALGAADLGSLAVSAVGSVVSVALLGTVGLTVVVVLAAAGALAPAFLLGRGDEVATAA
jgi:MFS family permease